jgi:ABC-2 type transport system permease protein
MKFANILAIARKDWIEVLQNKYAWMPILILPILFDVLMPLGIILLMTNTKMDPKTFVADADLEMFFRAMPESIAQFLHPEQPIQFAITTVLGYMRESVSVRQWKPCFTHPQRMRNSFLAK